jgi:hypothetical protein
MAANVPPAPGSESGPRNSFYSSFGALKSAMYNCVGERPSRLDVHITFVESGLNTGGTSCPGAWVGRVVYRAI